MTPDAIDEPSFGYARSSLDVREVPSTFGQWQNQAGKPRSTPQKGRPKGPASRVKPLKPLQKTEEGENKAKYCNGRPGNPQGRLGNSTRSKAHRESSGPGSRKKQKQTRTASRVFLGSKINCLRTMHAVGVMFQVVWGVKKGVRFNWLSIVRFEYSRGGYRGKNSAAALDSG